MPVLLRNAFKPHEFEYVDLQYIINMIREGSEGVKEKIEVLRKCETEEKRKKVKLSLPMFNLGEFESSDGTPTKIINDHFKSTEYIFFDVDNLKYPEIDDLFEDLKQYACFMFYSPSGKGLKFAIKMDKEIKTVYEYRYNFQSYYDFFKNEYDLTCKDKKNRTVSCWDSNLTDPRRPPFISYDPLCFYNESPKLFHKFDTALLTASTVRSTLSYNDDVEISDLCNYLANLPTALPYDEWIKCGMALKNMRDGLLLFKQISLRADTTDSEIDVERKFNSFKEGNITIATLYYIAEKHGYSRNFTPKKSQSGADSGKLRPYLFDDIMFTQMGWLIPKYMKSNSKMVMAKPDLAFSWNTFLLEGEFIAKDNSREKVFNIDGKSVQLSGIELSAPDTLRRAILTKAKNTDIYMNTKTYGYPQLIEYITASRTKKEIKETKGIGNVVSNLWNLGNIVATYGFIQPYDEQITVENKAYKLKRDDRIFIDYNIEKYTKLMLDMDKYYKNKMPLIIGWATAQVFTLQVNKEIKTPLLFLHGLTSGGKTTLSDVILAMYGVDMSGKNKDNFRVSLSSNSTTKGASRLRDEFYSIPMHFDEYRDDFSERAKTWYDRSSDILAVKSTDNQVYQREINSGTIISSVNISKDPQLINRCVYINFDKNRHENTAEFDNDIMENMKYFGSFLIDTIMNYKVSDFEAEYEKSLEYIDRICPFGSPRIKKNYAVVRAGAKLNKHLLSPENQHNLDRAEYWLNKIDWVDERERSYGLTDSIMGTIIRIINDYNEKYDMYFKVNKFRTKTIEGRDCYLVSIKINESSWGVIREYNNRGDKSLANIDAKEAHAILIRHPNREKEVARRSVKTEEGGRKCVSVISIYHPIDDFSKVDGINEENIMED